jgi:hypothetical protein
MPIDFLIIKMYNMDVKELAPFPPAANASALEVHGGCFLYSHKKYQLVINKFAEIY